MKDLLLPRHRSALARLLGDGGQERKVLLAFDHDGVLAPIVREPSGARAGIHLETNFPTKGDAIVRQEQEDELLRRLVEARAPAEAEGPVAVSAGGGWRG